MHAWLPWQCVGVPPLHPHGRAGLLPCGGADVFLRSDASHAGRPGGAERRGVHERLLPVCFSAAAVSGDWRIHRHGHVPPHCLDILQLPAVEKPQKGPREKSFKEEEVKGRRRGIKTATDIKHLKNKMI